MFGVAKRVNTLYKYIQEKILISFIKPTVKQIKIMKFVRTENFGRNFYSNFVGQFGNGQELLFKFRFIPHGLT